MSRKILVAIPAYNCAPQIGRVIAQFDPKTARAFTRIMVINNRSTDGTEAAAIAAFKKHPHLRGGIYTNPHNLGYGGSLKVGFGMGIEGGYDFLLVLHGDDQGHVRDMMPHIADGSIDDYDCTLGARFHPESELENYSAFRTFGNHVFNGIFGLILGLRVFDLGSGLNIYRLAAFDDRDYLKFPDNLTFDYCGLMSHRYRRRKIRFVPITWREDDQVSNVSIARQAMQSLGLLARFASGRKRFLRRDKMARAGLTYTSSPVFEQTPKARGE